MNLWNISIILLAIVVGCGVNGNGQKQQRSPARFTTEMMQRYRERVRRMFYHAYDGYLNHAFPLDELKPISCVGQDTWGSFSLSLIDALDTLLVLGNASEFQRAVGLVLESVRDDANVNVSVFETNIRVVGGLVSAHMLAARVPGMVENWPNWPCDGPLLKLAVKMADRLLPAFNTETGMPYGTVNLRYGVHKEETPVTCTAGVGTFIVEFGALSRLTGDDKYEKVALKALDSLWSVRSPLGLVGNHINVMNSQWTATDSGIGAGVDSYFEYLVKGAFLFQRPSLMKQFNEYVGAINKYVRKEDWFMWVSMTKGTVSLPIFQSLEAFWPGLLTMVGDLQDAQRIMLQYSEVIRKYGFPPEFYNVYNGEPVDKRAAYPLRPEMAESLMYLYRADGDPHWLELGAEMIDAIDASARTRCGYATINNVKDHSIEDRMESFFLAETTKYLYLLFDPENFIHDVAKDPQLFETENNITCAIYAGGYIFNTEAHPIDPGMLDCCSTQTTKQDEILRSWEYDVNVLNIIREKGMGKGHRIKKENVDEEEKKRSSANGGEKYFEKQYGSEELEYEVDEDMKKEAENLKSSNKKPESTEKSSITSIEEEKADMVRKLRELLRATRHVDETNRKKGEKAYGLQKLLVQIKKAYPQFATEIAQAHGLALMDYEEDRRREEQQQFVMSIPVPEALCENCCFPLNESTTSLFYRHFLADIFEFHIYPTRKVSFLPGPVCWDLEEPRIEDNYMNQPPVFSKIFIEDENEMAFTYVDYTEGKTPDSGFSVLRAPGVEFLDQFVGGGEIAIKKKS